MLIAEYWISGKPLPDDDRILSKIAGLSKTKWEKIRKNLEPFFVLTRGMWRHKRAEKEIANAEEKHARRASAGQRGGVAKAQQSSSNATAKPEQSPPQRTEDREQRIKQEGSQGIMRGVSQVLTGKKPWTPERKKAAWQSRICTHAQSRLATEKYAEFIAAWSQDEPWAIQLAEGFDRELRAARARSA